MLVRLIQTAKGRKMDKSSLIKAEKSRLFSVFQLNFNDLAFIDGNEVGPCVCGAKTGAAGALLALIGTDKHMIFEVRHRRILFCCGQYADYTLGNMAP